MQKNIQLNKNKINELKKYNFNNKLITAKTYALKYCPIMYKANR